MFGKVTSYAEFLAYDMWYSPMKMGPRFQQSSWRFTHFYERAR